jgi:hypothetical protein
MSRSWNQIAALVVLAGVLAAASPAGAGPANTEGKDVRVVNLPEEPIPASIVGTPTVSLTGTPTVGLDPSANTVQVQSSAAAPLVTVSAARPMQLYTKFDSAAILYIAPIEVPGDRPLLLRRAIVAHFGGNYPEEVHFIAKVKTDETGAFSLVEIPVPLENGRGSVDLGGIYLDPNADRARPGDAIEIRAHFFGDGTTPRRGEMLVLADQL